MKDKNGQKCTKAREVLNLWKSHFEKHLNTFFPRDETALISIDIPNLEPDQLVVVEPEITKDEIVKAIKETKRRKAPGANQSRIEVLNAGGEKMVEMLHKIFNLILKQEATPQDFSKMVITPIHKKGDRLDPQNYRAIALLSIPGKIFLRILVERMKDKVKIKLKETQYGFRAGRGNIGAIFIVRQIFEKAKEKKICLNFHFIDFKSAFDTVWRKALWRILRSIGVNQKYINIIEKMYEKTECSVIIDKNLTEWFRVKVGVRQGCILSPTFFNIFLEFVMDELSCLQSNIELDDTLSTDIRYADDTTFISTMFEKLQISTRELETACRKWGLKINSQKCKVMSRDDRNIYVENSIVKIVDKFVFLGSVVPGSSDDIQR